MSNEIGQRTSSAPDGASEALFANAPDLLSGEEGATKFVRRDLAATETDALAYALANGGYSLDGLDVDLVEMLPIPDHFIDTDASWWTVRPGTPDAVAYWRFQL